MTLILRNTYLIVLLLTSLFSVYYAWRYRQLKISLFSVYLVTISAMEVVARVISDYYSLSTGALYNIYPVLSILFFSYYYYISLKSISYQSVFLVIASMMLTALVVSCFKYGLNNFNITNAYVFAVFGISCSLLWFMNSIHYPDSEHIHEKHAFWVSAALLLWGTFSIFRIIPMYYFNDSDKAFLVILQYIFNVINIVTYVLYCLAFVWNNYRQPSS